MTQHFNYHLSRWLYPGYRTFLEVDSIVVRWWIAAFFFFSVNLNDLNNTFHKAFTIFICSIYISIRIDQFLHCALHCQTSRQNERCCSIHHACIDVCRRVPQQNSKDTLCISSYSRVKWGSASIIRSIRVSTNLKKWFCSFCSCISIVKKEKKLQNCEKSLKNQILISV